jgi:hypothetical protein
MIFSCIALFLLVGCESKYRSDTTRVVMRLTPSTPTASKIGVTEVAPTETSTLSLTVTPFSKSKSTTTPTPEPSTLTPIPRLNPLEARKLVSNLLATNSGCKLPCWWGIKPAMTTWEEAYNFLVSFAVEDPYIITFPDQSLLRSSFQFSTSEEKAQKVIQDYKVQNGIVEFIEVLFSRVETTTLADLLNSYGPPGEVWIRTFGTEYKGTIPFYLLLFYPDQGILALFQSNDATLEVDKVRKCFNHDTVYELALWSPNNKLTFDEAKKQTEGIKFDDPFPLLPLDKATELDINKFYEKFKTDKNDVCLETSADLWPGQYE